jgi:hypothetical protein
MSLGTLVLLRHRGTGSGLAKGVEVPVIGLFHPARATDDRPDGALSGAVAPSWSAKS